MPRKATKKARPRRRRLPAVPRPRFGRYSTANKGAKRPINNRQVAIQRADYQPTKKMIRFCYDETFIIRSAATAKASNTVGLRFSLLDPGRGPASLGSVQPGNPYWGAINSTLSGPQSDKAFNDPPDGWARWVSASELPNGDMSTIPFKACTVHGGRYTIRAEQLARTDNSPADEMVRAMAMCSTTTTAPQSAQLIQDTSTISEWQKMRGVAQSNMTVALNMNNGSNSSSVQQQVMQSGSFLTKKLYNATDLNDDAVRFSGHYAGPTTWVSPEAEAFLTIAFLDRVRNQGSDDTSTKALFPDLLVRVKIDYDCLLDRVNAQVAPQ